MKNYYLLIIFLAWATIAFAQGRCINYTGGIGEFETILPDISRFYHQNLEELSAGIIPFNLQNPSLKVNLEIDRTIKASGYASQKISIFKKPLKTISHNEIPYFVYPLRSYSSPDISSSTKDFYPKIGDRIRSSIKIKTSPDITNIRYQLRITAHYHKEGIPTDRYHTTLAFFITSSPIVEWTEIELTTTIPPSPDPNYQNLDTIFYRLDIFFPSSTPSSTINIWLDDLNIFVERSGQCILWPQPKKSSLKNFEVYSLLYPRDPIYNYLNNSAHLGSSYIDLIIKHHDPNYKYFFYINLTPLTKYFYAAKKGWTRRSPGEFNGFIDSFKKVTNTGDCYENMFPVRPNARYPEWLKINKDNPNLYKLHGCIEEAYAGTMVNYYNPKVAETYFKYLAIFDYYFPNPTLKYDAIFFDNLMDSKPEISRQTPTELSIKLTFLEFSHMLYRKIGGLFKYFGNWGYVPYIDQHKIFDLRNFYLVKDMTDGYLDEGWLWSPYSLSQNLNPDPIRTHQIFKTAIENQHYDYIMLIGAFIEGNCTSTSQQTIYMISSFYLVNNDNIYFALRPFSPIEGIRGTYAKPQCYDDSMYLPLGKPIRVNSISEIIVSSTPNFVNGALYRRKYENGLVLFNSSNNLSFQFQLPSESVFNRYRDHLNRVYNPPTIINIPPQSGLILYGEQRVE
ncbi:MAG: hypothetical protein NZ822_01600 [Patescibacteria group bacterium]|nr:hypothetical protein [Patescibacteria group bacterium]